MCFSPILDHLSHRNTLNHVGVRERKIGHGRSVVILQPCVDVLSLINKPVKMRRKRNTMCKTSISRHKQALPESVLENELSHVLHSFRVLSQEPDNIVEPSGEKQQQ